MSVLEKNNNYPIEIVYFSKSRQTEKFIEKVEKKININKYRINIDNEKFEFNNYILVTPTYFFGGIPVEVKNFLDKHNKGMIAVMSSGNRNWGNNFAKSGELISEIYDVDLISKYELAGTESDVNKLLDYINNYFRNKV